MDWNRIIAALKDGHSRYAGWAAGCALAVLAYVFTCLGDGSHATCAALAALGVFGATHKAQDAVAGNGGGPAGGAA